MKETDKLCFLLKERPGSMVGMMSLEKSLNHNQILDSKLCMYVYV